MQNNKNTNSTNKNNADELVQGQRRATPNVAPASVPDAGLDSASGTSTDAALNSASGSGLGVLRSGLSTFFKRFAVHSAAIISALIIAEGRGYFLQAVLFYFGAICFLPRGFSLRQNSYLVPFVTSLGQLVLALFTGLPLPFSLFLAGAQSWLQRAFIRHFHLGADWLPAPFLLGLFIHSWRYYNLPTGLFVLTFICGLVAYYAFSALDQRKRAELAAAEQQSLQASSPFASFYNLTAELELKAGSLPANINAQVVAIAAHSRNILLSMQQEQAQSGFAGLQSGSRFLKRYLPAAHKIIDEYTRLRSEGQGHQEIEAVLGRVDEMFERLAQAFAQEHGSLLQNDAMSFSAELQVLDKLLKMDGK